MMRKKAKRSMGAAVAVLGLTFGASALTAGPAVAQTQVAGCPWPYVCFYKSSADWEADRPVSMYKDMHYQELGPKARASYAVENGRRDDVVWIKMSNGSKHCLDPGSGTAFSVWGGGHPVAIDISDASYCR